MKKLSDKLSDRLISEGYELRSFPERHFTNFNLRESGAWRWSALLNCGRIGSCYTMKECVNAEELSFRKIHIIDVEVFPE